MPTESVQKQCQRFSNSDNNPLLCKSLLRGSLFCSSTRGELLFYCAWKFHLFFLQDHQNGFPHHRADLVRQVNGTRAKRISTTFVVTRPSFKRNFLKKQRYKLHYWLRASGSPVSQALVLYFNFSSSGRFSFAFNVHIWAPRSLCADVIENPPRHPGSRNMRPGPLSNAKHLPATAGKCKWQPAPASSLSPFCFLFLSVLRMSARAASPQVDLLFHPKLLSLCWFSWQSFMFFFFFTLTKSLSCLLQLIAPERKTYVSGFICDTFLYLLHK